jgi:hypothetical protein
LEEQKSPILTREIGRRAVHRLSRGGS